MTKKFLTVRDLATLLNLKESWIYDRTSRNGPEVIPHVKFGRQVRFDIESVEFLTWLKSHGVIAERAFIDSMNESDPLLGSVELTGAFTKRKEKRVNADTYQQGWMEWKTKSNGKKACRFRYWVRDEGKPGEWRKSATPWEEGLTEKQAKKRLRDLMTAMEHEPPKPPPVVVAKKGLTLQEFVESHWASYQSNRGIKQSTRDSNAASLKNHILPVLGSMEVSNVSPTHVSNFFQSLVDKHLSPKSVLNI